MNKVKELSAKQLKNKFEETVLSNSKHKLQANVMNYIVQIVGAYYCLESDWNANRTRKRDYVLPRQIAMYLMKNNTKAVLVEIGAMFNDKDHATVLYAVRMIKELTEFDKTLRTEVADLQRLITFKGKTLEGNINIRKQYYYVDLNNFTSIRLENEKAMILSGFSTAEIEQIKRFTTKIVESREHEQTGMYILEQRKKV